MQARLEARSPGSRTPRPTWPPASGWRPARAGHQAITSILEEGDPQLLAFASLLDARTPADLATPRGPQRHRRPGDPAYDDLHAAEVLHPGPRERVQAAKDDVAAQRRAAAAHLVTMRELFRETRAAKAKVRQLVDDARQARQVAARARAHDSAVLARLREREQDQGADPRGGPPGRRNRVAATAARPAASWAPRSTAPSPRRSATACAIYHYGPCTTAPTSVPVAGSRCMRSTPER